MPAATQSMECVNFKEVKENLETSRAIACSELTAFKGTAADFCAATLDALRGANGKAGIMQDTGRVINMCGNQSGGQAGGQKGNK